MKKRVAVVFEIDTEEWCKYALDDKFIENDLKAHLTGASNFYNIISIQPEIIRCKDCKHRYQFLSYWLCDNINGKPCDDGFCHYADRKNDG